MVITVSLTEAVTVICHTTLKASKQCLLFKFHDKIEI